MELNIEDFNTIGDRVPLIANLKPHGKVCQYIYSIYNLSLMHLLDVQFHMADLDTIGGLPVSRK